MELAKRDLAFPNTFFAQVAKSGWCGNVVPLPFPVGEFCWPHLVDLNSPFIERETFFLSTGDFAGMTPRAVFVIDQHCSFRHGWHLLLLAIEVIDLGYFADDVLVRRSVAGNPDHFMGDEVVDVGLVCSK